MTSLDEGIVGVGDAFHRGGPRMDAFLDLGSEIHRRALRFRCVGAASVLWTWLAGGQIQGMFLAHNNPYDVVAGHAIARAAGAVVTDYAGAPLTLDSSGAMAAVPGIHGDLIALAKTSPPPLLRRQLERPRRAAVDPRRQRRVVEHLLVDDHEALHRLRAGAAELVHVRRRPSLRSTSSGGMRTSSPPVLITPTAMLPRSIQPTPPNIFFSTTSGRAWISSRTRAARWSSIHTHGDASTGRLR